MTKEESTFTQKKCNLQPGTWVPPNQKPFSKIKKWSVFILFWANALNAFAEL